MRGTDEPVWRVRTVTAVDAGLIAQLVSRSTRDPNGFDPACLLAGGGALRVLFRDGVPVGLCGIDPAGSSGGWRRFRDVEFRAFWVITDGLDPVVACEVTDRLLRELASALGVALDDSADRGASEPHRSACVGR